MLMRALPSNSQEWFTSLLRPFKAYTFVGVVAFQLLLVMSGLGGVRALAEAVLYLYLLSVPVLILVGLAQLAFTPRRAALATFMFAAADLLIILFHLRYFVG